MVATSQDVFESLLNMHAPRKINKVRNEFASWLTSSVRDIMTKRDKMKKAATKNPSLWPAYTKLRSQRTNSIRKAIQDYHHGLVEETRQDHTKFGRSLAEYWKETRHVSIFPV